MTKDKDYSDILFGYSSAPACGCIGEDDGGFSVAVYPDGRLIYKKWSSKKTVTTK